MGNYHQPKEQKGDNRSSDKQDDDGDGTAIFKRARRPWPVRVKIYLFHHFYALFYSLGQVLRAPLGSLIAITSIAITLALPTGLYLVLDNLKQLYPNWQRSAQISLFLENSLTDVQVHGLIRQLTADPDVQHVRHIPPAEGLASLSGQMDLQEAVTLLGENPLPHTLVVTPKHFPPDQLKKLFDRLRALPGVEIADFDLRWLERLKALIELGMRVLAVIAGLLALAVLTTIGNAVRAAIEQRKEEIEVTKLLGAANSFVRRPYLYIGFWYGFLGAVTALGFVLGAILLIREPIKSLSKLYASNFELNLVGADIGMLVLVISIALGIIGAWVAVARHLSAADAV